MAVTPTTVLQQREISERTRSLSTLGRIDYADIASIATTIDTTPEAWARAIVEHAAGAKAQLFWRMIGLRLDQRSAGCIGGWRVVSKGDDRIVLEAASWYTTVNAVCEVGDDRVSLALLARFDRPFARLACPPVTFVHRRGIPMLLRQAARHLRTA